MSQYIQDDKSMFINDQSLTEILFGNRSNQIRKPGHTTWPYKCPRRWRRGGGEGGWCTSGNLYTISDQDM